jgi:hypothetical protein
MDVNRFNDEMTCHTQRKLVSCAAGAVICHLEGQAL